MTERGGLTSDAGEELTGKALDLTVGKRREDVALKEVKHALSEQVSDDADVISVIEAIPQMDALVPIVLVVGGEGGEDS